MTIDIAESYSRRALPPWDFSTDSICSHPYTKGVCSSTMGGGSVIVEVAVAMPFVWDVV